MRLSNRFLWITSGLAGALALSAPLLRPSPYLLHVLTLAAIYAIVTLGLNIVTGLAGQISLAQAAFWGLGAYCSALLTLNLGCNFWIALPVAACFAALFGVLLGVPTLKLAGHYLAMTTIGFGEIIRLILHNWKAVTNGADGLASIPRPTASFVDFKGPVAYYYLVLFCLLATAWITHRMKTSYLGRGLQAIKENELASQIVGLNTTRYKVVAFTISAFFAGLAGSLYAHLETFISPDTFSFDQSVVFLVMLLIGGAGSVGGALIGAVLLTLLPEWLRFLKDYYMVMYGSLVILLIIFMPSGIAGVIRRMSAVELPVTNSKSP